MEKQKHLEPYFEDGEIKIREVWKYPSNEPKYLWTDWMTVSNERDERPTYFPRYGEGSIFFKPILNISSHHKRRVTRQRKLIKSWYSDDDHCFEVVDIETKESYI